MSHVLSFEGGRVETQNDESVLNALLRAGLNPAFSCKSGSCQTCMLQAESGDIPERAQRVLPMHLRRLRYFLPCRCMPTSAMSLRRPHPNDLVTGCQLCEANVQEDGRLELVFETGRPIKYRTGQQLRILVTGRDDEPVLTLTSSPERDMLMMGVIDAQAARHLPPEMQGQMNDEEVFGFAFEVRGPFDDVPPRELPSPEADATLWDELGGDTRVRAVLEAFYAKVYADEQLAPFFKGVTMQRAIEKQYVFLRQSMTGEKNDFVDTPRNTHHWMIITHALFELRQSLMEETLREHGLTGEQLRRWTRFEEHYRPDIVKSTVWPRLENGVEVMNEGFAREVLLEATLCDHCGAEVDQGVEVLYHLRTGTVSCPACAPAR